MPTKEEIDGSPYHEKLQRPAGSATSRESAVSSHSVASQRRNRPKTAPTSRSHKKKSLGAERESKMVSKTLQRQL